METLKNIGFALSNVIGSYFKSDLDVMSDEVRTIMSNPDDKRKYIEAVDKLRSPNASTSEEVTFSTGKKITLIA